jgi:hypothetical protein
VLLLAVLLLAHAQLLLLQQLQAGLAAVGWLLLLALLV